MSWEFFETRDVKASRKARVCDECRHAIGIGEPYRQWSGCFEGEFMNGAVHGDCQDWAAAVLLNDCGDRPLLCDASPEEDLNVDALDKHPPPPAVRQRLSPAWTPFLDDPSHD